MTNTLHFQLPRRWVIAKSIYTALSWEENISFLLYNNYISFEYVNYTRYKSSEMLAFPRYSQHLPTRDKTRFGGFIPAGQILSDSGGKQRTPTRDYKSPCEREREREKDLCTIWIRSFRSSLVFAAVHSFSLAGLFLTIFSRAVFFTFPFFMSEVNNFSALTVKIIYF